MPDIVIILVMGFPMLLFTIFPALKFGDFLEAKYALSEEKKRLVVIVTTIFVTLVLSTTLFYA